MRLSNDVVIPAPPERIFALLNDVQRVAPCMPGATLEGQVEDGAYQGRVAVKVGPVSAAYRGTVRFVEVDEDAHQLVLDAKGTDQHGSGNAEAKVRVRIQPHERGSLLALETDLLVRGKVAQFGRGALGDVSGKLMGQFATNLQELLADNGGSETPRGCATSAESQSRSASTTAPATAASSEPADTSGGELNGLRLVALPLAKRVLPVAAGLVATAATCAVAARRWRSGGASTVLADELVTATLRIGKDRYSVPVRRITKLARRR